MSNTERTILKIINDTIESSSKPAIFVDKFRVTYYRFIYRSEQFCMDYVLIYSLQNSQAHRNSNPQGLSHQSHQRLYELPSRRGSIFFQALHFKKRIISYSWQCSLNLLTYFFIINLYHFLKINLLNSTHTQLYIKEKI